MLIRYQHVADCFNESIEIDGLGQMGGEAFSVTLDWIIDQYQVSTDKRGGINNDPNRDDDPQYIMRLIGQGITVSAETVSLVNPRWAFSYRAVIADIA